MRINSTADTEITYLPFLLREGEESEEKEIRVYPAENDFLLFAGSDADCSVMGRIADAPGGFQDLGNDPLDLSEFIGESVDILIKIVAADDLPGVLRKVVFLGSKTGKPAQWL